MSSGLTFYVGYEITCRIFQTWYHTLQYIIALQTLIPVVSEEFGFVKFWSIHV